jgi:hypothetical protein
MAQVSALDNELELPEAPLSWGFWQRILRISHAQLVYGTRTLQKPILNDK